MPNLCRICLGDGGNCFFPISNNIPETDTAVWNFASDIFCIEIQINDEFPQEICNICHSKLQTVHQFREIATNSDRILRLGINNKTIKEKLEDEPEMIVEYLEDEPPDNNFTDNIEMLDEDSIEEFVDNNEIEINDKNILFSIRDEIKKLNEEMDNVELQCKVEENDDMGDELCFKKQTSLNCLKKIPHENEDDHRSHKKKLKSDMKIPNQVVKGFSCAYCPKTFVQNNYKGRHENLVHLKNKNYLFKCQDCHKEYKSNWMLKNHRLQHHISKDDRPFTCTMCSKKFSCKSYLDKHMKNHLGIKEYQCKYCEDKFVYYTDCKRHEMRLHTGDYLYKCDECNKQFMRLDLCKKHKATVHGNKEK